MSVAERDDLLIRPIETAADRAALLDLYHQVYIVREGWDACLMDFYRDLVNGGGRTWIARQAGHAVGGIAAELGADGLAGADRDYYELHRFAAVPGLARVAVGAGLIVRPGARFDLGPRLLAEQLRWLAEQGIALCFGNARPHRIAFYRQFGLRPYLPARTEPVMRELSIPLVAALHDQAGLPALVRTPRPVAGAGIVLPPSDAVLIRDSHPRSPRWEHALACLAAPGSGALALHDPASVRRLLAWGVLFACPAGARLVLAGCREEGRLFVITGHAVQGSGDAGPVYGPGAALPALPTQDIRILDADTWILWLPEPSPPRADPCRHPPHGSGAVPNRQQRQ